MSLRCVHMTPEVFYACTMHALTIEKEEIMGLLIGKFDSEDDVHISSIMVLQRSDKRKDRVEISTEQLNSAFENTTALSERLGEPINVVGWYHSHPHITVQPSHVDLRTQATYQLLDNRFVGVILSVFNEDRYMTHEVQITCFQSLDGNQKIEVPLFIHPLRQFSEHCIEELYRLPSILSEEDLATYYQASRDSDILTKYHNDATFIGSQCHILRSIVNPLLLDVENRIKSSQKICEELRNERDRLSELLSAQIAPDS